MTESSVEALTAPLTLTERELAQVRRANASGRTPVVFIHGLWLLANSWDRWATMFEAAGYAPLTPGWPHDPETVPEANVNPDVLARKSIEQVVEYVGAVIAMLDKQPAIVGHSFGGLFAQMLGGRGRSAATVAIDPAPFRGVLPLPFTSLKSVWPVLDNPAHIRQAVRLSFDEFRYAFANTVSEAEAHELYVAFAVPGAGEILFQGANANLRPSTEAKVDTRNAFRGPLLIISGEDDNTVPPAVARATFRREKKNHDLTELVSIPGRGHSLTIDHGWREVADRALGFIQRFV